MSIVPDASPVTLPDEPLVDEAQACAHGLTPDEYRSVIEWLGGAPRLSPN